MFHGARWAEMSAGDAPYRSEQPEQFFSYGGESIDIDHLADVCCIQRFDESVLALVQLEVHFFDIQGQQTIDIYDAPVLWQQSTAIDASTRNRAAYAHLWG